MKGRIFSISRFATDDGDGIRTVVFFKGCPLSCKWCHNAESVSFASEISYSEKTCIACGACVKACKNSCHGIINGIHSFDRTSCDNCGACADACPTMAIMKVGEDVSVAELAKRVLRDKDFYGESGGVTLSGGEPTAQFEFVLEFSKEMKREGINVNAETCGFCKTNDILELSDYVDTFLFDCKASKKDHLALTGVESDLIEKNLCELSKKGADIVLRCPIAEGANSKEAYFERIGELSKYARYVELLPYHKIGVKKSESMGKASQAEFDTPSAKRLSYIAEKVKSYYGKEVKYALK